MWFGLQQIQGVSPQPLKHGSRYYVFIYIPISVLKDKARGPCDTQEKEQAFLTEGWRKARGSHPREAGRAARPQAGSAKHGLAQAMGERHGFKSFSTPGRFSSPAYSILTSVHARVKILRERSSSEVESWTAHRSRPPPIKQPVTVYSETTPSSPLFLLCLFLNTTTPLPMKPSVQRDSTHRPKPGEAPCDTCIGYLLTTATELAPHVQIHGGTPSLLT